MVNRRQACISLAPLACGLSLARAKETSPLRIVMAPRAPLAIVGMSIMRALYARLGAAIAEARASGTLERLAAQGLLELRQTDPKLLMDLPGGT